MQREHEHRGAGHTGVDQLADRMVAGGVQLLERAREGVAPVWRHLAQDAVVAPQFVPARVQGLEGDQRAIPRLPAQQRRPSLLRARVVSS